MSMAVRLCKMLEKMLRQNESAIVNQNDDTVFDIKSRQILSRSFMTT